MEINFSSKVYSKSLLTGSPHHVPYLRKSYLVQKYGGRYFAKVLFINLFYFIVSIGIATYSIIMDVAFVIETAERHFVYFIATKLLSLASYCFHFVMHLFAIC